MFVFETDSPSFDFSCQQKKEEVLLFQGDSFSNLTWIVAYHTKNFHCENFEINIEKIFTPNKLYREHFLRQSNFQREMSIILNYTDL